MQANKPVEHQRIDSDSDKPKPEVQSLSSLPDLSKFGLSAPYPKTLVKQLEPELKDDNSIKPEWDSFSKIPVESEPITSSEDQTELNTSQQIDHSQIEFNDRSNDYDPADSSFVDPPYMQPENSNQTMFDRIKTFLTIQHSFKVIPYPLYIGFILITFMVVYCLIVVILDKLGFKSTVTYLLNH